MADTIADPVMGLTIPIAEERPGPQYAADIQGDLSRIAVHTHTGASHLDGYQVPSAGLNINADLPMGGNNLTSLRSARMVSQSSPLIGVGDVNSYYFINGDAWVNEGNGTPVQLTSNGSVLVSTSNVFPSITLSVNHTIGSTDVVSAINYKAWSASSRILTLPLASQVSAGRYYFVKDQQGAASGATNITINPNGSDKIDNASSFVIDWNFGGVLLLSDGVSNWQAYPFSDPNLTSRQFVRVGAIPATGGQGLLLSGTTNGTVSGVIVRNQANSANVNVASLDPSDVVQIGDSVQSTVINKASTIGLTGTMNMGASANLTLSPSRSKVILQSLYPGFTTDDSKQPLGYNTNGGSSGSGAAWVPFTDTGTTMTDYYLLSTQIAVEQLVSIAQPLNGATLTSVRLYYKPRAVASPAVRIRLDVNRIAPITPSSPQSLMSAGFSQVPAYASTAWTFADFAMDQNNILDTSSYFYIVRIKEEAGAGSSNGSGIAALAFTYTVADFLSAAI